MVLPARYIGKYSQEEHDWPKKKLKKKIETKWNKKSASVLAVLIYPSSESLKFTSINPEKNYIRYYAHYLCNKALQANHLWKGIYWFHHTTGGTPLFLCYFPCASFNIRNWKAALLSCFEFSLPTLTTQQATSSRNMGLSSSCQSTPYRPSNGVVLPQHKSKVQLS